MEYIQGLLMEHRDEAYAEFQRKLIPSVAPESVIGVRTPDVRRLAKRISGEACCKEFLRECPHKYYDENQLHGFIISGIKDFHECIEELERFLPFIDNWATCDQTSPKVFRKKKKELLPYIEKWLRSEHTYTVRFAIGMLMQHFLDDDFRPEYLEMAAGVKSDEYYINMEIAWYMATALAKQWESAVPYVEEGRLAPWTHNKAIQKARESRRITDERKEYLKSLKRT